MPNLKVNGTRHIEIMGGGGVGGSMYPPTNMFGQLTTSNKILSKTYLMGTNTFVQD